jgi:hypothetical protein
MTGLEAQGNRRATRAKAPSGPIVRLLSGARVCQTRPELASGFFLGSREQASGTEGWLRPSSIMRQYYKGDVGITDCSVGRG